MTQSTLTRPELSILYNLNVDTVGIQKYAGEPVGRDELGNLRVRVVMAQGEQAAAYGHRVAQCFSRMTLDGDPPSAHDNGDEMCFRPDVYIIGKECVITTTAPNMFKPWAVEKFCPIQIGTDFFKGKRIATRGQIRRVLDCPTVSHTGMVEFSFMDNGPNETFGHSEHIPVVIGEGA